VNKKYQKSMTVAPDAHGLTVPEHVPVALAEIAGNMREGLLALAVGAGLQVMNAMMEADVTTLAGVKGKHDRARVAVRHGHERGSVTLGGRRVPVCRPRVRAVDGSGELPVPAYELFSGTEILGRMAMGGCSLGSRPAATRSAWSRSGSRSVSGDEHQPFGGVAQVRGPDRDRSRRAAQRRPERSGPGRDDDRRGAFRRVLLCRGAQHRPAGHQAPLALVEGPTENATLTTDLLVGLRDRGLDVTRPILVVLNGSGALRKAVVDVFDHPVIARCQLHKTRNVQDKLPQHLRGPVGNKMRAAYHADSALLAEAQLQALARELDKTHPRVAASLREGLAQTLTVLRLGVPPTLARTLRSTNAIESMIGVCRQRSANVKRWRDGDMAMRWCAAGMVEAGKQFPRVNGHLHLASLRAALEREVAETVGATCHDNLVSVA